MIIAGRRHTRGFTLLELMITLAIAVILLTVAVPGFQALADSQRRIAAHNLVMSGLRTAKSEAGQRREAVTARYVAQGDGWGMEVVLASGTVTRSLTLDMSDNMAPSADEGEWSVTFDSLGRRASCSAGDCFLAVTQNPTYAIQIAPSGHLEGGAHREEEDDA